jgi:uncharacterized protein YndB with AHSA1/START domain
MAEKRNNPVNEREKGEIVITRVINASRELVFKAWTTPEHLMRWWAPKGCTTPFCTIDLRPGGAFRFCMRLPNGKDIWARGIYREIIEPERIVYVDSFTDEKGNPVPASYYGLTSTTLAESLVTVTFNEYQGKTKLTLRHSEMIETGVEREMTNQGWNEMFDRLEEILAKKGMDI